MTTQPAPKKMHLGQDDVGLCGNYKVQTTLNPDEVTCARCTSLLSSRIGDLVEALLARGEKEAAIRLTSHSSWSSMLSALRTEIDESIKTTDALRQRRNHLEKLAVSARGWTR